MSGFSDSMRAFVKRSRTASRKAFVNTVSLVKESITDGSPLTGSPGQPVDTGNLKDSWHTTFESEFVANVTTNVAYAKPIEEGIGPYGPMTVRSEVGGFHSVKLTAAGIDRLVDLAVRSTGA